MRRLLPFIAVISAVALAGCSAPPPSDVHVGYVEAEFVYVAPPKPGWLIAMPVREGDVVQAGDLLFELDKDQERLIYTEVEGRVAQAGAQVKDLSTGARPAEIAALQAQLDEAKARLAFAQSELERSWPLIEDGVVAKVRGDQLIAERDSASARVNAAEEAIRVARLAGRAAAREAAEASEVSADAALDQAEWHLEQRTIVARVGGRVELVFHRQGEYVMAGSPVLALFPDNALKVRFFIPQAELHKIVPGKKVTISADGLPQALQAEISYIASQAEFTPPVIYSAGSREKLVFLVEARLPAGSTLRPGLPVDVRLP